MMDKEIKKPVCPYCKEEMKAYKYGGYYDAFDYWACDCERVPDDAEVHRGEYA